MKSKKLARVAFAAAVLALSSSVHASPQTAYEWGVPDLSCTSESMPCVDPALPAFNGGYRAGGSVSWSWDFDRNAFASVDGLSLDVAVVGMWQNYPGNIDPAAGQIGNFLAVDGTPYAPFLGMTDGRDVRSFALPTSLAGGMHTFSVVAYGTYPGPRLEGWGGVDYAKLAVSGIASPVPEPASVAMLVAGVGVLVARARRKR